VDDLFVLSWLEFIDKANCTRAQSNKDDAQHMAQVLRSGVVEKKLEVALSGVVECDEVYVVAGHKGQPEAVKKRTGADGATG
jgi:hypothetical protein